MYDEIAMLYHLIYRDWNAVIAQQAAALDAIIRQHVGPSPRSILDVSCGIGIQALGLAALGHAFTAQASTSCSVPTTPSLTCSVTTRSARRSSTSTNAFGPVELRSSASATT